MNEDKDLHEFDINAADIKAVEGLGMVVELEMPYTTFTPQNDWLDFAKRWAELRRQLRKPVHYCRLAVAIRAADGQRLSWDEYLDKAATLLTRLEEDTLVNQLVA